MKFISAMAALAFLISCTAQSPREFADKFVAAETTAWTTGNLEALEGVEDPAVVYHMPGLELKGWKAHADYITHGRTTVRDLKQNWKYLSGEGNHFALAYESTAFVKATDKNPPMSIANNYLFVVRTNNGKVVEIWMNGSTTSTEEK
jgi:hypothetical protein